MFAITNTDFLSLTGRNKNQTLFRPETGIYIKGIENFAFGKVIFFLIGKLFLNCQVVYLYTITLFSDASAQLQTIQQRCLLCFFRIIHRFSSSVMFSDFTFCLKCRQLPLHRRSDSALTRLTTAR